MYNECEKLLFSSGLSMRMSYLKFLENRFDDVFYYFLDHLKDLINVREHNKKVFFKRNKKKFNFQDYYEQIKYFADYKTKYEKAVNECKLYRKGVIKHIEKFNEKSIKNFNRDVDILLKDSFNRYKLSFEVLGQPIVEIKDVYNQVERLKISNNDISEMNLIQN